MFIDCHAHLHVRNFDADRDAVIRRAYDAKVQTLINVGFDVEGNFQALALAKKYEWIFATMGVHPHGASEWNESVAEKIYTTALHEPKIVALGEMGLDYYLPADRQGKNFQPKALQKDVFRAQLQLAKKLSLPVIIHCRDAFDDCYALLAEEKMTAVLMHCFTGTMQQAEHAWKRGYYTAFTGVITYPSAAALREVVRMCPRNLLLIETDCPYLAPQSHRGQRNEPAFLTETGAAVAQMRNEKLPGLAAAIASNARRLFKI